MKDTKKFTKKFLKKTIALILISIIVFLFIVPASDYFLTIDDGEYKEGDNTNALYAVSQYTDNVSIGADGKITSNMTAQELWDDMVKNGNRALHYLDTPEQLLKLMNAELVTQYPDTRANPDEPIDWNADELNDVNSKDIQGIIKLKRADSKGSNYTMKYVDPDTFQKYIDNYNASGSEDDKNIALSHFTLQAVISAIGQGGQAPTIEKGTTINIPEGLGSAHTYMGWQKITSTTSSQYKLRELAGMNFDEEGFGIINGRYVIACTTTFGRVGDYIDFYFEDGSVLPGIIGDIKNQNDAGCTEWGHNNGKTVIEFIVDKSTWYNGEVGGHVNPGNPSCHPEWKQNVVKAVNGGSYFDDPTFGIDNITSNDKDNNNNDNKDNNSTNNNSGNTINYVTKYYAKVATWSEQTITIESDDPDVEGVNKYTYSMSSTNVNYQDMVKDFTMPFEYLWSLLVISEDIDLTLEIANLVYNSEIEVTIHDNLEINTNISKNTYTKKDKIDTSAKVTVNYGENATSVNSKNASDTWSEEKTNDYTTIQTIVTKTNTLNVALTKADVWMETYTQKFEHEQPTLINTNTYSEDLEDIEYSSEPNSVIDNDKYGHAEELLNRTKNEYVNSYNYVSGNVKSVQSKIYNSTINRKQENTDNIEKTNYVSSPADIKEKTDPESTKDNFVTILKKQEYINSQDKIIEVFDWWVEILENNESTSDMVDLTRYLLYKITGNDYGMDKYDFSQYNTSGLNPIGGNGLSTATGSKIVDIARTKLGCKYKIGQKGPYEFDCSGFVYWVYQQVGITVPGSTDGYKAYTGSAKEISWNEAKPGDILLVFNTERGTQYGHAGIYLGEEEYIHAPQPGDVVKVSSGAKSKFKHVFRFFTEANGGTAAEGDGYDSTITLNNKNYNEYKQSRGSYTTVGFGVSNCSTHNAPHVHSNGCGPTSVAIIASGYGKNYSPGDIATLMGGAGTQSSGNTISSVLNKIGISSHPVYSVTKQNIKAQLSSGRPFVVSVDGSLNGLFTKSGHLMSILAIDSNDNVYVSNPNPATKNGWVPLDTLYTCCRGKYAIFIDQN